MPVVLAPCSFARLCHPQAELAVARAAGRVLIGRPYLFGLAAGGEAGVSRVLSMIRLELEFTMAFAGAASVADIDRTLVSAPGISSG